MIQPPETLAPMSGSPETRGSLLLRLSDWSDQQAWAEFYEIYEPVMYRIARQHNLQDADAREIVQEVCWSVSRAIEKFERRGRPGSFRAWLMRVTRNETLNLLKKRGLPDVVGSGLSDIQMTQEDQGNVGPAESIEQRYDHEHRRQVFLWAAEKIRPRFSRHNWEAFWRTSVEGEGISDVADDMGLTIANVHVARCRIMARLRELVKTQVPGESES